MNFSKLEIGALRRYKQHFGLKVRATASKQELINAVTEHFLQGPVQDEETTILNFIHANRTRP